MPIIATEEKTICLKSCLNGMQLKKMLNILADTMTAWSDEGSLKINFIAIHDETTIAFSGGYAEALELLEKYPGLIVCSKLLWDIRIEWKNTKILLIDANKMKASKKEKELEIRVESDDIAKTKKIMAAALKSFE